jgi:hypothetical protein
MLQVFHKQAREVGAGGPLERSGPRLCAGSEASATAPTCMCSSRKASPAGAAAAAARGQVRRQQRVARRSSIVRAGGVRRVHAYASVASPIESHGCQCGGFEPRAHYWYVCLNTSNVFDVTVWGRTVVAGVRTRCPSKRPGAPIKK